MGLSNSKVDSTEPYGYVGETDDKGLKHGQGTFTYPSGSVYEGSWVDDRKHGQGRFVAASGNVYEGMWSRDVRAGPGRLVSAQGVVIYEGAWEDDKMHGEGGWKEGRREGGEREAGGSSVHGRRVGELSF